MENKFFRLKRIKAQVRLFAPVLFLILALILIGVGVSNNPYLVRVRTVVTDAFVPIVNVVSAPVRWVRSGSAHVGKLSAIRADNDRLKKENDELRAMRDKVSQLTYDNQKLGELLSYRPVKEKRFVTARVIADNGGAFSKSILIQVGAADGIKRGAVVLTSQGVLGRVIDVGQWASRILLITDYTSRIPVRVGTEQTLAILTGDNTPKLKLVAVPEGAAVKLGDLVVTSGHAGVYPAGLEIGKVVSVENDIYVQPFTDREKTEFVRIVDYGLEGLLPSLCDGDE